MEREAAERTCAGDVTGTVQTGVYASMISRGGTLSRKQRDRRR